jgi:uroporphyrinogen-III synthase
MRVLVTRSLPDGERTAAELRARGHQPLLVPLMKLRPMPAVVRGNWAAVLITSANALRVLSDEQIATLRALPLYAVGQRTADEARERGFAQVHSAHGDATDLVRLVAERHANETAPYLYLAGEDRAAEIEGVLRQRGIRVETVVVYRMMTTGFPPELFDALERRAVDAVLHFSRRSAENYLAGAKAADLIERALAPRQFCLSAAVVEPLRAAGATDIAMAGRPDEASLLALLPRSSSL